MSEAERAEAALGRARAAIESVDRLQEQWAQERQERALRGYDPLTHRTPPPAPEPRPRGPDSSAETIAARAAVAQQQAVNDRWNAWFVASFRSQLPTVWDVLGRALGEVRAEIEKEYSARLDGMTQEIASLRSKIAGLRSELEALRQPETPPAARRLRRVK